MKVVKGIILRVLEYTEDQKIVHVFTEESGFLSLISPAFLFKKRKNPLHLLQISEIEFFPNEKGNLHKLKRVEPMVNLSAAYFDVYKMNIMLLWGEILYVVLKNEQKNEALYDYLYRSIDYLNTAQKDVANFNLFFLYRLPALIGFKIDTPSHSQGNLFNVWEGNFVTKESGKPFVSGVNAANVIYKLCTCELQELSEIALDGKSRSLLLDIILLFFSVHLNVDLNGKNIRVIRELFS
ncbi:MAG: DNA repair protein RecO [Culturomica sp.]|jgi:DNA repair protein RecO (recombination protein O)|nr:DNA repair protein RecO [Culturomica sp.]